MVSVLQMVRTNLHHQSRSSHLHGAPIGQLRQEPEQGKQQGPLGWVSLDKVGYVDNEDLATLKVHCY